MAGGEASVSHAAKTLDIDRQSGGPRSHRGAHGEGDATREGPSGAGLRSWRRRLSDFHARRALFSAHSNALAVTPENEPRSRYRLDMGAQAAQTRLLARERAAKERAERESAAASNLAAWLLMKGCDGRSRIDA